MNIAELGIRIDTTGADKATSDLDKLTAAGDRAEQSTTGLMGEINALEKSLSQGAKSTQELAKQRDTLARLTKAGAYNESEFARITKDLDKQQVSLVKSTLDEQKALNSLLAAIDPAQAKLSKLDSQVQSLGKAFDQGKLTQQQYSAALSKIDSKYSELDKGASAMSRLGLNTRQAQENVVQLGNALSTGDVGSGLRAITQLGAEAKISAASIASIAVPAGIAAAAIGTVVFAWIDGQREASAFNRALSVGNNAAGLTADGLQAVARRAADVTRNFSASREAAIALAESGKVSADQLQNLTEASAAIATFTGKGADEVAKGFASMGRSASVAAENISQQYGLITYEQYQSIKAIEDNGGAQEALDALSATLNENAQSRLKRYRESLSDIERVWDDIKEATKRAYAEVRGEIFPDATKQLELVRRQIKFIQENPLTSAIPSFFTNGLKSRDEVLAGYEAQATALEGQIKLTDEQTKEQSELDKANQRLIDLQKGLDAQMDNISPLARRTKAVKDLKTQFFELYEASERTGTKSPLLDGVDFDGKNFSGGAYDSLLKGINDRIKDRRTPKAKAYTEDAGTKALDNAKQQYAVLLQQESAIDKQSLSSEKIGVQAQALIKFEQQLADIKEKKTLTAEQKSLLANQELIRAQLKRNADLEASIIKQQQGVEAVKQAEKDRIELLKLTGQALAANAAESGILEAEQRLKFEREGNVEALKRLDTLKKIRDVNLRASQKTDTVEGVSKAPQAAGLDAVVGGAASEITRLDQSAKELSDWREKELQRQKEYLKLKAINEETYNERVSNINTQSQDNQAKIEDARNKASLESASEFFGTLATLTQSENKKLAAIGKAAAIAQATVDGFLAAQKALASFPPPFNFIAAAAVGVATAANVAGIAGVGFMDGGYTGNGRRDEVAGPVHRGEYVFDAQATSRIGVGNLEALRSGNITASAAPIVAASRAPASSGAGNPIQITQHNSYPGISSANEAKKSSAQASRDTVRAIDKARRHI